MKIYKYFLLHNKKLKPWIKHWLYINSKDKNYVLSDILQGTSFYLENSSSKNFNLFQISGNSIQNGTPTPTNPVEIKSAGDNNIKIIISNKNLFKIPTTTIKGVTCTQLEDGAYCFNGTATADSFFKFALTKEIANGTNHVLSCTSNQTSSKVHIRTRNSSNGLSDTMVMNVTSSSITSTKQCSYSEITIQKGAELSNFIVYPQLELGSSATSFVPHQEQNISIPCQQPMRSIGDIRDVFVKQDGLWYEKHNIGVIESYNGETITTDYMSTTGSLSTGAFVQYVLNEPNYIECTQEQTEALESIIRAYTYEPITFINSTDTTPAFLKIRYYMEV